MLRGGWAAHLQRFPAHARLRASRSSSLTRMISWVLTFFAVICVCSRCLFFLFLVVEMGEGQRGRRGLRWVSVRGLENRNMSCDGVKVIIICLPQPADTG